MTQAKFNGRANLARLSQQRDGSHGRILVARTDGGNGWKADNTSTFSLRRLSALVILVPEFEQDRLSFSGSAQNNPNAQPAAKSSQAVRKCFHI